MAFDGQLAGDLHQYVGHFQQQTFKLPGQVRRTGGERPLLLNANNDSMIVLDEVDPAVFDGCLKNRSNLFQGLLELFLDGGFHSHIRRAFQGFQFGLLVGGCLFDFVDDGGLGRCRRKLIENRAGAHGYLKDGHLALHTKRFRQFTSDLFELLCVDLGERQQQDEKAHQQRHQVRECHYPGGNARFFLFW